MVNDSESWEDWLHGGWKRWKMTHVETEEERLRKEKLHKLIEEFVKDAVKRLKEKENG